MIAEPTTDGFETGAAGASAPIENQYHHLKRQLIEAIDQAAAGTMDEQQLKAEINWDIEELCRHNPNALTPGERERLVKEVIEETLELGPLALLMYDPTVTDILVNGAKTVYVERQGRLSRSEVEFADDRHLLQIIQRIVARAGRHIDESTPYVDAALPDGSRINAIIPPLVPDGPHVSIRRFGLLRPTLKDLVQNQSITRDMVRFLSACVEARLNILISGGTGSGKTTLLNCLSAAIPNDERVVTIEDALELRLQQPHVVRQETRPANVQGAGEVTARDLVRNALRMRPDRIVVGECRGAEALDMLQAMHTGHPGSMTTIHANDSRDALGRLEMMVGMTGLDLPIWVIRRQIVSAIQIVVQVHRLPGGARKVVEIAEVTGVEGDVICMQTLFGFEQNGVDPERMAYGKFYSSGILPTCLRRLEVAGTALPACMFKQSAVDSGGLRAAGL